VRIHDGRRALNEHITGWPKLRTLLVAASARAAALMPKLAEASGKRPDEVAADDPKDSNETT
jgi:hypothetical protein